jgi:hypothetical protein
MTRRARSITSGKSRKKYPGPTEQQSICPSIGAIRWIGGRCGGHKPDPFEVDVKKRGERNGRLGPLSNTGKTGGNTAATLLPE